MKFENKKPLLPTFAKNISSNCDKLLQTNEYKNLPKSLLIYNLCITVFKILPLLRNTIRKCYKIKKIIIIFYELRLHFFKKAK